MAHLDVDSNGKVTFEEFTKYFLLLQTLVAPRRFREMLANMEAKAGIEPATTSASARPPAVARQMSRSEEMASVMVRAATIFAAEDQRNRSAGSEFYDEELEAEPARLGARSAVPPNAPS
tara:strand:+ start:1440 stop:1799 length:360 start_codon:yes stop_codon:yes gene_type:complete